MLIAWFNSCRIPKYGDRQFRPHLLQGSLRQGPSQPDTPTARKRNKKTGGRARFRSWNHGVPRRPDRGRVLAGTAQTSSVVLTTCTVNNANRRGRSSGSYTVCSVRPTNWCAIHPDRTQASLNEWYSGTSEKTFHLLKRLLGCAGTRRASRHGSRRPPFMFLSSAQPLVAHDILETDALDRIRWLSHARRQVFSWGGMNWAAIRCCGEITSHITKWPCKASRGKQ